MKKLLIGLMVFGFLVFLRGGEKLELRDAVSWAWGQHGGTLYVVFLDAGGAIVAPVPAQEIVSVKWIEDKQL